MSKEVERLDREIHDLGQEIADLTKQIEASKAAVFDAKVKDRRLPPMSRLTRTQKRYVLEPWFTVGGVAAGAVAAGLLISAAAVWSWRLVWAGLVVAAVAGLFISAKLWHLDVNLRTEGRLESGPRRRDDYY